MKMQEQFGEMFAEAEFKNLGFRQGLEIKKKGIKTKFQMKGQQTIAGDLEVDPFGLMLAGMTEVTTVVKVWGKVEEKVIPEEAPLTVNITKDEDWDELPYEVGDWIGQLVMKKFFRTTVSEAPEQPGATRMEHQGNIG